jgi:hypothetical protein
MVTVCATFSADPSIMGLAQMLQQLGGYRSMPQDHGKPTAGKLGAGSQRCTPGIPRLLLRAPGAGDKQEEEEEGRSRAASDRPAAVDDPDPSVAVQSRDNEAALLSFTMAALHECITGEKAGMLMSYIHLYCLLDCQGDKAQVRQRTSAAIPCGKNTPDKMSVR